MTLRTTARAAGLRNGVSGGEQEGVAIPLLSQQDRFVGYLGIEHASLSDGALREHGRVLSVFGDLLAGYLSRQRAERALSESEERWRKFVEFNPEAILVVADDAILYANQACAQLLGLPDAADLGRYALHDFLPADQYDVVEDRRRDAESSSAFTPFEHEIVRLDGEERVVETIAVGVPFKGIPAVQVVIRDVTDRKRSEERYRNFVQTISEGVWRIDLAEPTSALALPYLQADRILTHGYLAECNTMMTRLLGAERTEAVIGQPIRTLVPSLDRRLVQTFVEDGYRLHNYELTVQGEGASPRHFALNAVGRIERGALVRIWGSCVEVTERVEMERRMVAVLEEQQERIGRDLHDSVGQLLTGIRMLSENLGTRYFDAGRRGGRRRQEGHLVRRGSAPARPRDLPRPRPAPALPGRPRLRPTDARGQHGRALRRPLHLQPPGERRRRRLRREAPTLPDGAGGDQQRAQARPAQPRLDPVLVEDRRLTLEVEDDGAVRPRRWQRQIARALQHETPREQHPRRPHDRLRRGRGDDDTGRAASPSPGRRVIPTCAQGPGNGRPRSLSATFLCVEAPGVPFWGSAVPSQTETTVQGMVVDAWVAAQRLCAGTCKFTPPLPFLGAYVTDPASL